MIFEFNADFTAFTGKWSYNDATPSSKWNGTRIAGLETKSQPSQTAQQGSQPSTKTATAAAATKSADTKDNLNKADVATGSELQKQISSQVKGNGNEAESNSTSANSNRKPLSEYEKSLVKEAKAI